MRYQLYLEKSPKCSCGYGHWHPTDVFDVWLEGTGPESYTRQRFVTQDLEDNRKRGISITKIFSPVGNPQEEEQFLRYAAGVTGASEAQLRKRMDLARTRKVYTEDKTLVVLV